MQQFDYIFAGFGLSGMTLFYELSKDPDFRNKTVLIVDRDAKNQNDRTWSFWADAAIDFQHLVKKQWKRGDFYTMQGEHLPMDFGNFTYNTIEGADFYAFMNQYVEGFENVERLQTDIVSLNDAGELKTLSGDFKGEWVFRSYFDQ
jgi:lycopene beta-cyclase